VSLRGSRCALKRSQAYEHTDQAGGRVGKTISPDEACSLAVDPFMLGHPLVLMDIT
jgi:hypothetical protein